MDEVFAVVAEEQAQVKVLEDEGRVGTISLSLARGTVFIEVVADDAEHACPAADRHCPLTAAPAASRHSRLGVGAGPPAAPAHEARQVTPGSIQFR